MKQHTLTSTIRVFTALAFIGPITADVTLEQVPPANTVFSSQHRCASGEEREGKTGIPVAGNAPATRNHRTETRCCLF